EDGEVDSVCAALGNLVAGDTLDREDERAIDRARTLIRRLSASGQGVEDTKRLDWLLANEYDLVARREDMGEDECAIWWFVTDSRRSTKLHLHSVSGHPLGSPREAIDAARLAADSPTAAPTQEKA